MINNQQESVAWIYVEEVCRMYRVGIYELLSKNRTDHMAAARAALCYALRERLHLSFPRIGAIVHRNHTSVMSADQKTRAHIAAESAFDALMRSLLARIELRLAESELQASEVAA